MKLFGQHVHFPILLLITTEYGAAALAFALAAALALGVDLPADMERGLAPVVLFSTAVVLALTAVGLYQTKQRLRMRGVAIRLFAALALAVVVLSVADLVYQVRWSASVLALSCFFSFTLLAATRMAFVKLVDHDAFRRKVLVYGAGERAGTLLGLRRRADRRGFKLMGFVPAPGDHTVLADQRVLAIEDSLLKLAQEHDVDEIVVAMDERRNGFPLKDLLACKFAGIGVIDLITFFERETGRIRVDLVNPAWLIFSESFSVRPSKALAMRVVDLMIATVVAVLSLPIAIIVALAILVTDGFPLLYKQERVGLWGRPFMLYKFRSMVRDAEAGGRAQWAGVGDSRVTPVGKVIRKLRLDELPQLFNVLRGDMSLVGPRPERPEFVSRLSQEIPYYQERHCVKPGLTGWAQLCYPYGSSDADAMEKLQYDLYYIKHRSLVFDFLVILQTVEVVLWGKGAR